MNFPKDLPALVLSATALLILPAVAQADSVISKSLGNLPTSIDLNDFDAWAYYADTTTGEFGTVSNTSPTTNDPNSANFSAVTPVSGSVSTDYGYSQNMDVTYTGGTGGANPTSESSPGVDNYDFTVGGLTLSTKLIATTETLHFYLYAYQGASDLSLALAGGPSIALYTNTVLPEVVNGDPDGSGDNIGELSVTVQGGIGDVLDFSDIANNTDVSGNGHTGIEAVTIDVPEPSTYAMLLGDLVFLGFGLRRKLALS